MALPKLRHIPGWERPFLSALQNGHTELVSANCAGVSLKIIKQRAEKDPAFKQKYDEVLNNRRGRPVTSLF